MQCILMEVAIDGSHVSTTFFALYLYPQASSFKLRDQGSCLTGYFGCYSCLIVCIFDCHEASFPRCRVMRRRHLSIIVNTTRCFLSLFPAKRRNIRAHFRSFSFVFYCRLFEFSVQPNKYIRKFTFFSPLIAEMTRLAFQ